MLDLITLPESLSWGVFLALILLSCFTSMLTAAAGIGGGMLMLAALAQLLPVKAIIPIHGVVQLGSNVGRTAVMFKDVRWDLFLWFTIGSIFGALLGGQIVVTLPADFLRALLGGFILFTVWGPKVVSRFATNGALGIGGLFSTFLTMFVGATGPFVIAMLRTFNMSRLNLIATSAASLSLQHGLKIIVFGLLGFAFAPYLPLIILMIASGFIGTIMGRRILIEIDEQRFQRWLNIILSLLALRLLYTTIF